MKHISFICMFILSCTIVHAQHSIKLTVKSSEDKLALAGATATIVELNKSAGAGDDGRIIFENIPAGNYTLRVSFTEMAEKEIRVTVPVSTDEIEVLLEQEEEEEEEVVVSATRLSRTIANIPTRVEVISGEELAEKANMKPGDIRMLLNETTGIQTQQTSATSFNAGIRIQGLEGRYTQMLKDGYPLYSGFSGGLSILQIVPLDLKQVEVIKGSASTLYGGGAIAGLVNLVSKTPGPQRELSFLANATSARGLDISGFYSERFGKTGLTLFASRNSNAAFDPANIGLTAIPEFERYTVNPRLFLFGKKLSADLGVTYITEDRTGGSINYIKNGGSGFFEKNNTDRITTQAGLAYKLNDHSTIQFKNSFSYFDRVISIPGYVFDAIQQSSFSELSWNKNGETADWVIGTNFLTEDLNEQSLTTVGKRNYHFNTTGIFIQNVWTVSNSITLESGLRGDYTDDYGFEVLPRVSALIKITPKLHSRIGGGFGYKTPSIFTEEGERVQFQNIPAINTKRSKNERSVGGNWDINYRTKIGAIDFSINQLFFYTRLSNPLVLLQPPSDPEFVNHPGHLDTRGIETNMRLVYGDFKLFLGYTFTDANTHFSENKEWIPLTARHRLNNVLMYEIEEKLKLGLEAYYFSRQKLRDNRFGKSYWVTGFMAEKLWKKFSVYINFENFTDSRQSKFDTIYTGSIDNPVFNDIYAPVEGFVVNGGIKISL